MADNYNIGDLEVRIISDATKAVDGLNKFTNSLTSLSSALSGLNNVDSLNKLASGINNLTSAVNVARSVDARAFSKISRDISTLANTNASGLSNVSNHIQRFVNGLTTMNGQIPVVSDNVVTLASAISRLGNKGVTQAITNIPLLATSMRDLMTTLSNSPQVSQNVIDMTNALANFVNQSRNVGNQTTNVGRAFSSFTKRVNISTRSFKGLASSIGMFYAKFFLLIRAIKKLWDVTESAMNYVETFNYWTVALNKISKEYETSFSEIGDNSAESFAESYSTKLKSLIKKMTGYTLGDKGELIIGESTGLGLDPNQLMEYQAQIMGITNSVGLLGDTSIDTAKALSMLSADLSSLTNTDLSTVMTNLQSGLVGQSRALYKYGIDITSATLQEYAHANAIEEKVSAMSQSEKMQLRILAILDQSRVAWGDQANTLGSVANQYRVLKQQMSNLGRIIGNLVLPAIKMVLPYLNAIVIVLQRLFTMLGYKLWGDSWLSDLNEDISSIGVQDMEDYSDALDDATDSAKKLKSQLLGIDEINNLSSSEGSGSNVNSIGDWDLSGAISDALEEYEKVWNDALARAKNKANDLANKIMEMLTKLSPYEIGKLIASKINEIDWDKVFSTTAKTIVGALNRVIEFFGGLIGNLDFSAIGVGLGNGINYALKNFKVIQLFGIANDIVVGLLDLILGVLDTVDFSEIGTKFGKALRKIKWTTILAKVAKVIIKALGACIKTYTSSLSENFFGTVFVTAFALLKFTNLSSLLGKVITPVFNEFFGVMKTQLLALFSKIGTFITTTGVAELGGLIIGIPALLSVYALIAVNEYEKYITRKVEESVKNALQVENLLANSRNGSTITIDEIAQRFTNNCSDIITKNEELKSSLVDISESKKEIEQTVSSIESIKTAIELGAKSVADEIPNIISEFQSLKTQTQALFNDEYNSIIMGLAGAFGDAYVALGGEKEALVKIFADMYSEGNDAVSEMWQSVAQAVDIYESSGKTVDDAQKLYDTVMPIYEKLAELADTGTMKQIQEDLAGVGSALYVFDEDGNFDSDKFNNKMQEITDTMIAGSSALKDATEEYQNSVTDYMKTYEVYTGKIADQDAINKYLESTEKYVADNQTKYLEQYQEYSNTVQQTLLEDLPSIIKDAEEEYAKLNPFEKMFTTEGDFVDKAVTKWETETARPILEGLQKSMDAVNEEYGTKFETWGQDVISNMIDNLYQTTVVYKFGTYGEETTLKRGWSELLNGMLADTENMVNTEEYGKNLVQGFADGVDENSPITDIVVQKWADTILDAFHKSHLQFGSPSKTMMIYGEWAVQGFADGLLNENSNLYMQKGIKRFVGFFEEKFTSYNKSFYDIGTNIVKGIIDGISGALPDLKDTTKELAKTIKDTTEEELDINSPSRVMFDLGQYTTQGFMNGMQSLFGDTEKSLKNFTGELADVPKQTSFNGAYGANTASASLIPVLQDALVGAIASVQGNTNVNVTLEGDAQGIFKVVRQESNKYQRRTGQPAFS